MGHYLSDMEPNWREDKKMARLYMRWRKYLSDSRLPEEEIGRRARLYAKRKEEVPDDG